MSEPPCVWSTTTVEFSGDRRADGPLTWGQSAMWNYIVTVAPEDHWLNLFRLITVPARQRVDVPTAAAAIGQLVTGHESLRTHIRPACEPVIGLSRPSGTGSLSDSTGFAQFVADSGTLRIEIADATAGCAARPDAPPRPVDDPEVQTGPIAPAIAEACEEMLRRLVRRPFAYADEWPVRAGLVVVSGLVRHILLVVSHVAADGYAVAILVRDLRRLLAGRGLSQPDRLRPLDLAARERADTRRTERAIDHWRGAYERIPRDQLAPNVSGREEAPGGPARPRYHEVLLTSPAVLAAASRLAERRDVTTSTVLLAATAAMMGVYTGHPTCGLVTIVNNRHQAGHDEVVASISQLGLVVLDVPNRAPADPAGLADLLPATWQAALTAYRFAYYDPNQKDRALRESGRGGEVDVDPYCCFNDVRGNVVEATPSGVDDPASLLDRSTVQRRDWEECSWRFLLAVRHAPDGVCLALTADTWYLAPDRIEEFLRDLERYVVAAAVREPASTPAVPSRPDSASLRAISSRTLWE